LIKRPDTPPTCAVLPMSVRSCRSYDPNRGDNPL
jgi:hypothetical protein